MSLFKKKFHVPCFFFISFYYFFPIIKRRSYFKMKARLERLFIPYIIWPLLIWNLNNILYLISEKNRFGRKLSFKELEIQLITGRMFYIQLWYIFNLLFLSILFFILSLFNKYLFLIIIIFVGTIFYLIQEINYIYFFFQDYKDCIAHSVGHFIISFPIAVWAFISNDLNIIKHLEIKRFKFLIIIYIIIPVLFIYGKPNTYCGIDKLIFSLLIFLGCHLIPLNKYLNEKIKNFIYFITSNTQGIYCLHIIIKFYIYKLLKFNSSFLSCIIIYIICYIISFIFAKIFEKNKMRYLFI